MAKLFVWYSGATDITGKKLAEALKAKHGSNRPSDAEADVVLCWGAKTKDNIKFNTKTVVLNHPDRIRDNRNKLLALERMLVCGVNVERFVSNPGEITATSLVKLPVIGRTKYHQGGKGFWMCPTMTHVNDAIAAGASYFQNMIEIKDEFRIHVFGDKVIYAVKKVKKTQEEIEASFIEDELARQKSISEKNKETFDEKSALLFLKRQAKKFAANGSDMMIRSNRLGWKFSRVKTPIKELYEQAVLAVRALGLNFGAVDVCVDAIGKPWVIEVNTGPGLEETTFTTYVDAIKAHIESLKVKDKTLVEKVEDAKKTAAKSKAMGAILKATTISNNSAKSSLLKKMELMKEMAEAASDDEAVVLDSVFGKMFEKEK